MTGVYSIAEVVDDSNKRPNKTILVILQEDNGDKFDKQQLKSLASVSNMIKQNGGQSFNNLKDAAIYINNKEILKNG